VLDGPCAFDRCHTLSQYSEGLLQARALQAADENVKVGGSASASSSGSGSRPGLRNYYYYYYNSTTAIFIFLAIIFY
jgi:hypothetical protein